MGSEYLFVLTTDTVDRTRGDVLMLELYSHDVARRVLARPEVKTVTLVDHGSVLVELKRTQWGLFGVHSRKLILTTGYPAYWLPPRGTRYDTICFGICEHMLYYYRDCIHKMPRFSRWLRSPVS